MPYVNRGSVMAVGVTFVATSVIAVAMRFAIRLRQRADIGPDDWLSLAAMVSSGSQGRYLTTMNANIRAGICRCRKLHLHRRQVQLQWILAVEG